MIELTSIVKRGVLTTERRHFRQNLAQRWQYLRLDLNENLTELSKSDFAEVLSRLSPETFSAYPDLAPIYRAVSKYLDISEDNLVLTNGSDMAIKTIFDVCIEKGDRIVIHDPYFLMYERYAQFSESELTSVPLKADWSIDTGSMLSAVTPKTKAVVVESPSGNTGIQVSHDELKGMARVLEAQNVLLIIDEAYAHVLDRKNRTLELIHEFSNVIIVRTLSKSYGLAGARIGLLVSNELIARELYKVRSLYEISGISASVAEWYINHPEVLERYIETMKASKAYLFDRLRQIQVEFRDTAANFVIVRVSVGHTSRIAEALKRNGILIGKAFSLPVLQGWARVTVGTEEQCRQFADALELVMIREDASRDPASQGSVGGVLLT